MLRILSLGVLLVASAGGLGAAPADPAQDQAEALARTRGSLGFATSPADLSRLTSMPPSDFGVPLFDSEIQDLERRAASQAAVTEFRQAMESADGWGGLYIDQSTGGTVNVLVKEAGRAKAAARISSLNPDWQIALRSADFSLEELVAIDQELKAGLPLFELGVVRIGVEIPRNRIVIGVVGSQQPLVQRLGEVKSRTAIVIEEAEPISPGACSRSNCPNPIKGGLAITSTQGTCTSGLMMRTGSTSYATTAGHCSNVPETGTVWKHNGASIGTVTKNPWFNLSRADVAAIDLASNSQESNKIYTSSTTTLSITSRQAQEGDNVGDLVCHSGISSGVECGTLEAAQTIYIEGTRFDDMRRAQVPFTYGDSGDPVWKWNTSMAVGIGSSFDASGNFWYSHVYWVEDELNLLVCTNSTCS